MTARIRAGILTISDRVSRGAAEDRSGPALRDGLPSDAYDVVAARVVPDEIREIVAALRALCAECDLVLTTGGTGLSPSDVTPEATLQVVERLVPGIPEALRADGYAHIPTAILSRGVAGTVGRALIVNLPGSPGAVREALGVLRPILPHAIETLRGEGAHGGRR